MSQHALRTAITLYQGGTLDLETAARQAGVSTDRLERAVDRHGGVATSRSAPTDRRVALGAD